MTSKVKKGSTKKRKIKGRSDEEAHQRHVRFAVSTNKPREDMVQRIRNKMAKITEKQKEEKGHRIGAHTLCQPLREQRWAENGKRKDEEDKKKTRGENSNTLTKKGFKDELQRRAADQRAKAEEQLAKMKVDEGGEKITSYARQANAIRLERVGSRGIRASSCTRGKDVNTKMNKDAAKNKEEKSAIGRLLGYR